MWTEKESSTRRRDGSDIAGNVEVLFHPLSLRPSLVASLAYIRSFIRRLIAVFISEYWNLTTTTNLQPLVSDPGQPPHELSSMPAPNMSTGPNPLAIAGVQPPTWGFQLSAATPARYLQTENIPPPSGDWAAASWTWPSTQIFPMGLAPSLPDLQTRQLAYLAAVDSDNQTTPRVTRARSQRRQRRSGRSRQPPYAALGTREDVENPDYQSPISSMFSRAWDRYRTAEETRQAERLARPHRSLSNPLVGYVAGDSMGRASRARRASTVNMTHSGDAGYAYSQQPTPWNSGGAENMLWPQQPARGYFDGTSEYAQEQWQPRPEPYEASAVPPPRRAWTYNAASLHAHAEHDFLTEAVLELELSDEMMEVERAPEPASSIDTQDRPAPRPSAEMVLDMSCKICTEQPIDTVLEPCMHAFMCHWCAEIYMRWRKVRPTVPQGTNTHCPLCKRKVTQRRKIFFS